MMNKSRVSYIITLLLFTIAGFSCSGNNAAGSITAKDLAADIKILSSDKFEGRGPSSKGEEETINFLKTEFQKIGLKPGNSESYFQEVPLVEITVTNTDAKLKIQGKGKKKTTSLSYPDQYIAWTKRVVEDVAINKSELVFVGYGVVAPEYNWNDYEGLDVRGKTVVMLVNDPGFATQDEKLFNGNAMTYYGRWTYKFEEAARQGAEGALIVHEEKPAGYPWEVVTGSWSGPQFDLVSSDGNTSRCAIEGWLTIESTQALFTQAGQDFNALKSAAVKQGFKSVPLGLKASLSLKNSTRKSLSNNVIAVLPGTSHADEYIFYMAHWDHFGIGASVDGDSIFNGALDNATGTAALLEMAEAFTKLDSPPARSIAFLAVTAEEQGLLGSMYYGTNPVYPPAKTVAAINIDGLNIFGKMKDITIVGYGNSELDDYLIAAAKEQDRVVRPDPLPEKGYFYRSDHFSFAKQGIPALYTDSGIDHVEHGEEWTRAQLDEYTKKRYHKQADEYDENWDLSGAVEDLQLLFTIGHRLSMETTYPKWKEGTEFKAKREADRKMAKQ